MPSTDRTYVSVADTAKLVRKALKNQIPGVKFSVRSKSYSGGASIDVSYTDGPLSDDVKAVVSLYEGATFDGMIDLKSSVETLVADEDGEIRHVRYGADFIFVNRHTSPAREAVLRRELERFTGEKLKTEINRFSGHRYVSGSQRVNASVCSPFSDMRGQLAHDDHQIHYASDVLHQMAAARPWRGESCPGGDSNYCPGCGRYQGDHRAPHKR